MFSFKAIAIKQRKPFLNRDDGLDQLVINILQSSLGICTKFFRYKPKLIIFTLANEVRVIPTKYSSHFKTFLL